MMVDLILFLFVVLIFALGFWCGSTFGSFTALVTRSKAWLKEKLK